MGFEYAADAALVLRGLKKRSATPAADFEVMLDMPVADIMPYYQLIDAQRNDVGKGSRDDVTGMYIYNLAHSVADTSVLTLRPPKVRDMIQPSGVDQGVEFDMVVLSRLSSASVDTFQKMRLGDFVALQEVLWRFLAATP